jgi:hypothetical protein
VAKDKLNIPRPALQALRTKDMRVLQQYEDLYPSTMKNYLFQQTVEPRLLGKLASSPEIKAIFEEYSQNESYQPLLSDQKENGEPIGAEVTT